MRSVLVILCLLLSFMATKPVAPAVIPYRSITRSPRVLPVNTPRPSRIYRMLPVNTPRPSPIYRPVRSCGCRSCCGRRCC